MCRTARGKRLLITGGAGFIGSHLADELLAHDHQVRVLDVLSPQVHGTKGERLDYLNPDVEFICGDVCQADAVRRAPCAEHWRGWLYWHQSGSPAAVGWARRVDF